MRHSHITNTSKCAQKLAVSKYHENSSCDCSRVCECGCVCVIVCLRRGARIQIRRYAQHARCAVAVLGWTACLPACLPLSVCAYEHESVFRVFDKIKIRRNYVNNQLIFI